MNRTMINIIIQIDRLLFARGQVLENKERSWRNGQFGFFVAVSV